MGPCCAPAPSVGQRPVTAGCGATPYLFDLLVQRHVLRACDKVPVITRRCDSSGLAPGRPRSALQMLAVQGVLSAALRGLAGVLGELVPFWWEETFGVGI